MPGASCAPVQQALPRRIQAALVDLNGTLHVGDAATPGAQAALQRLRDAGVAVRFVTNTTKDTVGNLLALVQGLGFAIRQEEVGLPAAPRGRAGSRGKMGSTLAQTRGWGAAGRVLVFRLASKRILGRIPGWHGCRGSSLGSWCCGCLATQCPPRLPRLAGLFLTHRHPAPAGGAALAPVPAAPPKGAA